MSAVLEQIETRGVVELLGDGGLLSQRLPNYQPRRPQIQMAELVQQAIRDGRHALIEAGTGCIQGDAEIIVNRGGIGKRYLLSELVAKFNGGEGAFNTRGGRHRWNLSIPTYVQREATDGTVRLGRLKNAWCSGTKFTYTVTTETGRQIRATNEHPFLTERGWLRLDELVIGDLVHVRGGQATTGRQGKPRYQHVYRMHHHPFAIRRSNGSAQSWRHRLAAEARLNQLSYDEFVARVIAGNIQGLQFLDPKEFEVHHKDHNAKNDDLDNLEVLNHADHPRLHAEEGAARHVLYKVITERVVTVEPYGYEMTYDLEVWDEPHNFIANGFVVHNTGKSYAYIAPALLSGERVVISTGTIQLQEQLCQKDLPFLVDLLEPLLGRRPRFALSKGRSNWFCPRNAEGIAQDRRLVDQEDRAAAEALQQKDAEACLDAFRAGRWDGDKAHLTLPILPSRLGPLMGDDSCTGVACEHRDECPYLRRKIDVESADIIVTNHTQYLVNQQLLARKGFGILPEHSIWVADEAHTLPDQAGDEFGAEIHHRQPAALVRKLQRQVKRLKLDVDLKTLNLEQVTQAADAFFRVFRGAPSDEQRLDEFPPEVLEQAQGRLGQLLEALRPIPVALAAAASWISREDKETLGAIKRLQDSVAELKSGLLQCLEQPEEPDGWVRYVEVRSNGQGQEPDITLHCKPIEVRWIFRGILNGWGGPEQEPDVFDESPIGLRSAIFTSATLSSGPGVAGFRSIARDLSLNLADTLTLQVDSPFDYQRQMVGYIPRRFVDRRSPDYHEELSAEIADILNHTQGRAFVLFTSLADMRRVYDRVARKVRYPVMMQDQVAKAQLIAEFIATPNAVLFGARSFWTGVDIQGEALSCVIIPKLPFPRPDTPMNKARQQAIEARGGNGFRDLALPRCIQELKQGIGRLIRTDTDTGLVAILDPGMTKPYAQQIFAALPDFSFRRDLEKCRF